MEHQQIFPIAKKILIALQPYCSIINIAGSVRRKQPYCKDIEIVCVPSMETYSSDLFTTAARRDAIFIYTVNTLGKRIKGDTLTGKYIQIELPEGIKLDLFMPELKDYYRIFAIRTGSAEYAAKVIASAWVKKGLCGSDKGFVRQSDCIKQKDGSWKCINENGTKPPHWKSEQEFFEWLDVPYLSPENREVYTQMEAR